MSYYNFLKEQFTGTGSDNTPEGAIIRTGGKHVIKEITLSANNTTANVNVFQVTGNVKVLALHGHIKTKTTLTNLTNAYFAIWDGTAERPITKTTGASMSNYNVNAFFAKTQDVSVALTTANNSSGNFVEPSADKNTFQPFIAIQKTGTDTFIRFTYTTTDAPINATLEIHIEFSDIDTGTIVAV
jgi:hypothetical protein